MHATTITLREPRRGEGRQLGRYADQAMHGQKESGWIRMFAGMVDAGEIMNPLPIEYSGKSSGFRGTVTTTPYIRVLDVGERVPMGMIYSIQPVQWIMEESRIHVTRVETLVRRLVEVNLLGVHKNQRRRGYASAMLEDTEAHYRGLGFSTANVVIDDAIDPGLRPWYERRGYVFHGHDERAVVQLDADPRTRAVYTNVNPGQLAGFKALNPFVTIGRETCRMLTPFGKIPVDRDTLLIRGILG
jgi:GNAT superfamily N-acetyltransferase